MAEIALGSLFKGRFCGGVDRLNKRVDGCAFIDVQSRGFSTTLSVFPVIRKGREPVARFG